MTLLKRPATLILIAFNLYIFYRMYAVYGVDKMTSFSAIYNAGGMHGNNFYATHQWKMLITPAFVHIGLTHLVFNMVALASVGQLVEQIYGSLKTFFIYGITAVLGNVAAMFMTPNTLVAGASTALFGMFALVATLGFLSENTGIKQMAGSYLSLIIINLIYNLVSPGVSIAGHLGGAVAGVILAFAMKSKFDKPKGLITRAISYGLLILLIILPIIIGMSTFNGTRV